MGTSVFLNPAHDGRAVGQPQLSTWVDGPGDSISLVLAVAVYNANRGFSWNI